MGAETNAGSIGALSSQLRLGDVILAVNGEAARVPSEARRTEFRGGWARHEAKIGRTSGAARRALPWALPRAWHLGGRRSAQASQAGDSGRPLQAKREKQFAGSGTGTKMYGD